VCILCTVPRRSFVSQNYSRRAAFVDRQIVYTTLRRRVASRRVASRRFVEVNVARTIISGVNMDGSMASDRPLLNGKGSTRAAGCEEGSSHLVFQSLPSVVSDWHPGGQNTHL